MDKSVVMTKRELDTLMVFTVEYALTRILERYGHISPLISRQEMISQIGRSRVDEAIRNGQLTPIKNQGKNAKVYCLRSDFEKYLLSLKNM